MLDADHYDIEQVKDRILEFLAVRKLTAERDDLPSRASILPGRKAPDHGSLRAGRRSRSRGGRRRRPSRRLATGQDIAHLAQKAAQRRIVLGACPL